MMPRGSEKGTLRLYQSMVPLHIGPTLGMVKLARLSTPMLEGWRDRLIGGSDSRQPLSRQRARAVLSALKAIPL
jgi:hypothetical protein